MEQISAFSFQNQGESFSYDSPWLSCGACHALLFLDSDEILINRIVARYLNNHYHPSLLQQVPDLQQQVRDTAETLFQTFKKHRKIS
jgi:Ni,Fe-hydrogenase I small subunit